MEIKDIIYSFEDYRLESRNDSIDIDKLKEVLPAMIQQLVDEKVKEERKKIIGYVEFDKQALIHECQENISGNHTHIWIVLNRAIGDFNIKWDSHEALAEGTDNAVKEIIKLINKSIEI